MAAKTKKAVIIGAGYVGAQCAFALAMQGICGQIVLIDADRPRALAQAEDLSDAAACTPERVSISVGGYEDCSDADLVLFCAGRGPQPDETRQDMFAISLGAAQQAAQALKECGFQGVLLAVSVPCDIMARYLSEKTGLPGRKVIGVGTLLSSLRLRRLLAEKFGVSRHSVHAYVLGEHGESQMIPWSRASVGGWRMFDLMNEQPEKYGSMDLTKIGDEVRRATWSIRCGKGHTEFGPAVAVAEICRAVLADDRRILTVSTLLNGEYGQRGVYAGVPAVVGANGVEKVVEMPLLPGEQTEFDASCESLRSFYFENVLHG